MQIEIWKFGEKILLEWFKQVVLLEISENLTA